jgi:hypothetical protein
MEGREILFVILLKLPISIGALNKINKVYRMILNIIVKIIFHKGVRSFDRINPNINFCGIN